MQDLSTTALGSETNSDAGILNYFSLNNGMIFGLPALIVEKE